MKYRVILIEHDEDMLTKLSNVLKSSKQVTLVASYQDVKSALGQSSMFFPDIFFNRLGRPRNFKIRFKIFRNFPASRYCGNDESLE